MDDGELVDLLARKLIRRVPASVEFDDLVQVGHLGAMAARTRYTPGVAQFDTFASHRIRGAMIDYLREIDPLSRAERKAHNATAHMTALTPHDLNAQDYDEPSVDYETPELPGTAKRLQKALSTLTPNEQYVIRAEFWLESSQDLAARSLGLTPSRVCQIRKQALNKLRHLIEDE